MSGKIRCAIIGSGNIGTDLMMKILRSGQELDLVALVGIDPASDGLARARRLDVPTTPAGVAGLRAMAGFGDIRIVFDATSARAHLAHSVALQDDEVTLIDLTPAAIGNYCVPVVNLEKLTASRNINMVTCGGQATIPIVHAVSQVAQVHYAEIVASIASKSAGPGTRANIDEFTETTASAIESVGGAQKGSYHRAQSRRAAHVNEGHGVHAKQWRNRGPHRAIDRASRRCRATLCAGLSSEAANTI
jgi:acetaldehyde dehydrogenase